ncbi:cation-translocating P-type ATPase [Rhabdobacter roseus]|uniref:Ca2+-transporting ATPase n=1 Tax=Rhabdobacter roseus TaxID=1655419 RepID=A0A840TS28_9BACT|nr:cation-translocating P-type ATPase [Rhabdobacter roseus]MBB5285715.1 Ca2+-transporting ATPase [Rhabdobacter roseus]
MNWHQSETDAVLSELNTQTQGLSADEAQKRLDEHGKNELTATDGKSVWKLIVGQFTNVMILILMVAAGVSYAVGEISDAIIILVIVVLNALIGFVQEYRAEKALEALKNMSAPQATVRRDGRETQVEALELVPGDVVLLEAGNLVPADLRLYDVASLKVEEASLTGESEAVEKQAGTLRDEDPPLGDRLNMAYKNTIVKHGRAEGVVVATGMNTEMGRIAQLLQGEESQTPLQKRLAKFGKQLSVAVLIICGLLYGVGILRGEEPLRMLLTAISLAVAAIPEALPAVITIALALGAKRMVEQEALIRQLPAVETLGSVTYICSDKTGTITQNRMTVQETWQPEAVEVPAGLDLPADQLLLLAMSLNQDVKQEENGKYLGDPTEIALVDYVQKQEGYQEDWPSTYPRKQELPFDSDRKRMTTFHQFGDKYLMITKGAAEALATVIDQEPEPMLEKAETLAAEGKRVIAYSYQLLDTLPEELSEELETGLTFLGLVAMIDPPREEIPQAIEDCFRAGITPVMITGDHPATARAIASQVGIIRSDDDQVLTGAELGKLSPEAFEQEVESIKVYARVSPEQKLNIIDALQKKGHYVAMTGDGVNDAPALKKANIGVAMGITGTDVTKEASHMILLDDNFATIIKAVREGRRIFDNISKFIKYTLTSNTGEIWTLFLAPLFGYPIPLLPIHILWVNLVTDGLPGLALAAEPVEKNTMSRPPHDPGEGIFTRPLIIHIAWVGLLMGVICLLTQAYALGQDNEGWQTMVFTVLCLSQMGHALAIRSNRRSLFAQGLFSNPQLVGAIGTTLVLQLAVIYVPFLQELFHTRALSLPELGGCVAVSSLVFWGVEVEKWVKRRSSKSA